jgi:hypothetical protein
MSMSLDGFITDPNDDLDKPLGVNGRRLHAWLSDGAKAAASASEAQPELVRTDAVAKIDKKGWSRDLLRCRVPVSMRSRA